jgi:GTP-binding protein
MGAGLGDAFLRHIQRTKVLIHIIDGLSEDPIADFTQINSEMALFDPMLKQKSQLVVFNKMDIPEVQEKWPEMKKTLESKGYQPMAISAMIRQDLQPVLWKALELVQTAPEPEVSEKIPVYRPEEDPEDFHIEVEEGGFRVIGKAIERAAKMTYWEHEGSLRRFQRLMETLGVEDALRDMGIEEGQSVFIDDYELEWQD